MKFFCFLLGFLLFLKSGVCADGGYSPSLRVTFDNDQITAVIERFNYHRGAVDAKSMQTLTWNQNFSSAINKEVVRCLPNIAMPDVPPKQGLTHQHVYYLYDAKGTFIDVTPQFLTSVVDDLYDYGAYYNYEANTCDPQHETECLYYKYAVEATASEIGCAYEECTTWNGGAVTGEVVPIACMFSYSSSAKPETDRPYEKNAQTTQSQCLGWTLILFVAVLTESS